MNATPQVSVLMTVYNGQPYLEQSLQSVRAQTFRDYEFVIVDDGSTDGSLEVLRRYAAEDPRIRLIANEVNQGQTPCLNQGIAEARGAWIARQDADDLSNPRRLELQIREVTARPHLSLLGANGWLIDSEDRSLGLINAPVGEAGVRWSSVFYNPFLHTAVLFRRQLALDLGGYSTAFRIAQDYDLWMRIMEHHPADNLVERLVTYRVHGKSLSNSDRETTTREAEISCRRVLASVGLERFQDAESLALIGAFREGITPESLGKFWRLHARMKAASGLRGDFANALALMHWKAAGALAGRSKVHAVGEVARAFLTAPSLVAALFHDRRHSPA